MKKMFTMCKNWITFDRLLWVVNSIAMSCIVFWNEYPTCETRLPEHLKLLLLHDSTTAYNSILVQQVFLRKHGVRINCAHYSPNLTPRISKVEIEYEGTARGTNRSLVLKQLYHHNGIVLECSRSKCVYEFVHLFQTLYWIRRKLRRILISNVSIISLLGSDLSL